MGDQILVPIIEILSNADEKKTNIQPTLLYNEGWMLRLVLDWFAKNPEIEYEGLSVPKDCTWFSEALLPSPFQRGETGREGYTHADGVVGKFCIGCLKNSESVSDDNCATGKFCPEPGTAVRNKGKLSLKPDCNFFYVVEAKMGSSLSTGITNDPNYNQVARIIACIAELLVQQDLTEQKFEKFGFYVLLPKDHPDLKNGKIKSILDNDNENENIKIAIRKRMEGFTNDSISWLNNNLNSLMDKLTIKAITWEEILKAIGSSSLNDFYSKCKIYNGIKDKS